MYIYIPARMNENRSIDRNKLTGIKVSRKQFFAIVCIVLSVWVYDVTIK